MSTNHDTTIWTPPRTRTRNHAPDATQLRTFHVQIRRATDPVTPCCFTGEIAAISEADAICEAQTQYMVLPGDIYTVSTTELPEVEVLT